MFNSRREDDDDLFGENKDALNSDDEDIGEVEEWQKQVTKHQKEEQPIFKGFLRKEGAKVKNWKQRLFLLFGNRLEYYESEKGEVDAKKLKGVIRLNKNANVTEAISQKMNHCFQIILTNRCYYLVMQSHIFFNIYNISLHKMQK